MKKRYAVFAGDIGCADGGWKDLFGVYFTLEDAKTARDTAVWDEYDRWGQIVDLEILDIIDSMPVPKDSEQPAPDPLQPPIERAPVPVDDPATNGPESPYYPPGNA